MTFGYRWRWGRRRFRNWGVLRLGLGDFFLLSGLGVVGQKLDCKEGDREGDEREVFHGADADAES